MKEFAYNLLIASFLICYSGCGQPDRSGVSLAVQNAPGGSTSVYIPPLLYSDAELEAFFDSIGNLPPELWMDSISFYSDSIFKNPEQLDVTLSPKDFERLKTACKVGDMEFELASKIFKNLPADTTLYAQSGFPITFFSFDHRENEFNEFAIFPVHPSAGWDGEFYFFKKNKLIARHDVSYRHSFFIDHYKDRDGKTVVFYKYNFAGGSGIWQYNYYFYKYYGNQLIPVLNELENANLNLWQNRSFWLESTIQKTNPLTIKMVYHQDFRDSANQVRILEDSTLVRYFWDEPSRTLKGDYSSAKISREQIFSYYLTGHHELLFMNTHRSLLKQGISGNNPSKRRAIIAYLNEVKSNYYSLVGVLEQGL
ncbi:MAG: hypothetical protein HUU01_01295 [Saprospiraceae bacterium]|nr:hypothetical protein [Saprospiraceae bacterium]